MKGTIAPTAKSAKMYTPLMKKARENIERPHMAGEAANRKLMPPQRATPRPTPNASHFPGRSDISRHSSRSSSSSSSPSHRRSIRRQRSRNERSTSSRSSSRNRAVHATRRAREGRGGRGTAGNPPGGRESDDAGRGRARRGAARAASERRGAGVAREATANAAGDASAIADIVRERTEAARARGVRARRASVGEVPDRRKKTCSSEASLISRNGAASVPPPDRDRRGAVLAVG
jgi:hypothetical protein